MDKVVALLVDESRGGRFVVPKYVNDINKGVVAFAHADSVYIKKSAINGKSSFLVFILKKAFDRLAYICLVKMSVYLVFVQLKPVKELFGKLQTVTHILPCLRIQADASIIIIPY